MQTLVLGGVALGLGYILIERLVPRISDGFEQKEYEKIGYKKAKIGEHCVEDKNCEGFSTFGGDTVCRQGKCDPMVKTDSLGQVKYAAFDLGLPQICDKKYVMGVGMVGCSRDSQCSADGILYEATDPRALSATVSSPYYCANNNECKQKVYDWAHVYWKQEDPLAPPAGKGGYYDPSPYETGVKPKVRLIETSCKDIRNYMPKDYN